MYRKEHQAWQRGRWVHCPTTGRWLPCSDLPQWSLVKPVGDWDGSWSRPFFRNWPYLPVRSHRVGLPHCFFALVPLCAAWPSWKVYCRRYRTTLGVAIFEAVLSQSSHLDVTSLSSYPSVFQPLPRAASSAPRPTRSSLATPGWTNGCSELQVQLLPMLPTDPFASFVSGNHTGQGHRLFSRHT